LHFVDRGVDTGLIILQRVVEIKPNETIKSLQKKIHRKEEEILCQGIKLFSQGKLKIKGRKVDY
jgi:folate-dependent phosphoribosylglycinamide formyltransferase PurN